MISNRLAHLPPALVDEAVRAHASPGRVYHTFGHVLEVLGLLDEAERGPGFEHPLEVTVAALFHDAVYVPGRSDNESASADLARAALGRHGPPGVDAERVATMILATARHGTLDADFVRGDAALFLDADMAILGAPVDRFDAYDRAIADEFAAVPPELYAAGRRRFLEGLLGSPRIFLSDFFHAKLDPTARSNLRRAIARG